MTFGDGIQAIRILRSTTSPFADLKRVWDRVEGDRAHTRNLLAALAALDDRQFGSTPNDVELRQRLRRFGIKPEPNAFYVEVLTGRGAPPLGGHQHVHDVWSSPRQGCEHHKATL